MLMRPAHEPDRASALDASAFSVSALLSQIPLSTNDTNVLAYFTHDTKMKQNPRLSVLSYG
jgi:hypothetical protein